MAKNPYEVLGIRQGASQEEIKKAYRELVKQYHPDKYKNNPLADLAEEKLREINEAYETLTKGGGGYTGNTGGSSSYSQGDPSFAQVRSYINLGNINMAEAMLNRISSRTAEWYFLKGVISARRGNYADAVNNARQASSMDPGNAEYQQFMNQLNNASSGYRGFGYDRGYGSRGGGNDFCNACLTIWCLDSCCECGGGDCI